MNIDPIEQNKFISATVNISVLFQLQKNVLLSVLKIFVLCVSVVSKLYSVKNLGTT